MGTTANKLAYLQETKSLLIQAVLSKLYWIEFASGFSISDFRDLEKYIDLIPDTPILRGIKNNPYIKSIEPPSHIIELSYGCFKGCANLYSIILGENLSNLSYGTFEDCISLNTVEWNCIRVDNFSDEGKGIFQGCNNIKKICFGYNVESIPNNIFHNVNSTGIESVYCYTNVPPELGYNSIPNNNCPIYVPTTSVSVYQSDTIWSQYASRIQAMPS